MFVGITNTPRDYSWGSRTAIAELFGYEPTGIPEAELWLGAHPGSPSVILQPNLAGGAQNLAEWIARDPAVALTGVAGAALPADPEPRLSFLMKVLAAGAPLSLQAHPTPEQAREGFARENAAGIPLDAPFRNYKDAYPKPELMLALSDTFEALCGFRSAASIRADLDLLGTSDASISALHNRLTSDAALPATFEWLISRGEGVAELVTSVVDAAAPIAGDAPQFATVIDLHRQYPADPGIVISLLINRVSLKRGDVLYLPAGNIHAYLEGLGIEVMASSDNVLRGGLTPKHVDVPELLAVLDFTPLPVPYLSPIVLAAGAAEYRPDVSDFVLVHVEGEERVVEYGLGGPAIALCISGSFTVAGALGTIELTRGQSVYITPDESALLISGTGELVVATTGS